MNRAIVLGNDNTNSLGILQCLGRAGYEVSAFIWGVRSGLVGKSRYAHGVFPASSPQACIDLMIETFKDGQEPIPVIACCDAAALALEANKERLADTFRFEHSTKYLLEELFVKERQVALATEAGFNVPQSQLITDMAHVDDPMEYPCIIKPLVSCQGAKSDIRVCRSKEELEKNLHSLKHTSRVLMQQYIEHDYEISILGCGLSNGVVIIPCVENKLTLYPKNVGLECLANIQALDDETITRPIRNLLEVIGYVGLFSVEMMHCKEDGKLYFTEINLRNDGANTFIYKYGVNLPLLHVEDLLGKATSTVFDKFQSGYYIWEMHHLSSLLHRDISIEQWLKEVRMSKSFLTYFKEDRRPFFWQFVSPFLRKLHLAPRGMY